MKRTIIFIIAALAVVLGILVVGNLLLIGEKIGAATHPYVEYAFYLLMAGLLAWFVIIPVARLILMPEFPKLRTEDGWDVRRMRKFADSLAGNCFYIEDSQQRGEHRKTLLSSVSAAGEDVESLKKVITDEIDVRVRNINSLISRSGRKVFILTAASQNSTLDTLSVIVLNIRLIYNIVCATGYRPNIFQLTRIMAGVLGSAFTAYISQSLTNSLEGGLKNVFANAGVPIVGPLLGMLLNGSLNAALTLYVGYTTRNYVLKGPEALKNESDKASVMSSAVTLASEYIKESFTAKKDSLVSKAGSWVDKVVSWFTPKERVEQIPES
ncbi:MAG: DUF697 domain-containing protein [Bacteroidales bacterium]|nr:DUF697 domain-containing protein [Bacteroidales bacterium]